VDAFVIFSILLKKILIRARALVLGSATIVIIGQTQLYIDIDIFYLDIIA